MKYCILLASLTLLFGCGNDPDTKYPVLYTLDHFDQTDEGHYLVVDSDEVSSIPTNIGSFGANKDELKQEIRDFFEIAFNLKEVELISEDSLRIHFIIDEEEIDTIVNYSMINDSIVIDSLEGGLLSYDKDEDQFIICGVAVFALAGPNVADPGPEYYNFVVTECLPEVSNQGYALKLLGENDFVSLDTVGVILTRLIYK